MQPVGSPDRELRRVWRYLRALGASASEADDLAQETMLAALRAARAGATDIGDAEAFLLGIARNHWLRSRRWWQRRREREIADAVDQLWAETAAADDGDELLVRMRACLELLQPRARTALELHYRDGMRWSEIGPLVGLRPNGTKTLAQRSRQVLRGCIERQTGRRDT